MHAMHIVFARALLTKTRTGLCIICFERYRTEYTSLKPIAATVPIATPASPIFQTSMTDVPIFMIASPYAPHFVCLKRPAAVITVRYGIRKQKKTAAVVKRKANNGCE